jgi:hypothetical protein
MKDQVALHLQHHLKDANAANFGYVVYQLVGMIGPIIPVHAMYLLILLSHQWSIHLSDGAQFFLFQGLVFLIPRQGPNKI